MDNNSNDNNLQLIRAISSAQLERNNQNNKLKKELSDLSSNLKGEPIDKQLVSYEDFAKKLVDEDELIKNYIYHCACDNLFDIPMIAQIPGSLEAMLIDDQQRKNSSKMKFSVDDKIEESGGYYLYFKQNKKELLQRYDYGVPPWIKVEERLYNLGTFRQDIEESLNDAEAREQILILKAFKAKISNIFPNDEMEIKHAGDIPYNIKVFNDLLDKIEKLENSINSKSYTNDIIDSKPCGEMIKQDDCSRDNITSIITNILNETETRRIYDHEIISIVSNVLNILTDNNIIQFDERENIFRILSNDGKYFVVHAWRQVLEKKIKQNEFGRLFIYDNKPYDIETTSGNYNKQKHVIPHKLKNDLKSLLKQ